LAAVLIAGCGQTSEVGGSEGAETGADGSSASDDGPRPEGAVVLALVGDVMLGRNFNDLFESSADFEVWRDLDSTFADIDVMAINLETTITDSEEMWPDKAYNFKLDPEHAAAALGSLPLPDQARRYAATANNHVLDFEVQGMRDTLETLDELGFVRAGAGNDADAARAAAIVETQGGVKMAFLSAADHCGCGDVSAWTATDEKPGMWHVDMSGGDWEAALEAVRALRSEVHWIVFSLHWGPNYVEDAPLSWMRDFAVELIEAGVDVVHGHSSHHVLPVEEIAGRTVLYGPGDFVDDYAPREGYRNDLSFVAKIQLDPDGAQHLEIIPTRIGHDDGHYVRPLDASDPDYDEVLDSANPDRRDTGPRVLR
jgi:poly-gamma-glutamate synthesis protein (capsule biosynthesis protein)